MFDINALREETKARIQAAIPEIVHVSDYEEAGNRLACPAALVNIPDILPARDPGDGRVGLSVRVIVHIITKNEQGCHRPTARKQVESLAVKMVPVLHGERYAALDSPLRFTGGYGDQGDDKHRMHAEWGLEFTAGVSVGEERWSNLPDMERPEDVFADYGSEPEEVTR